MSRSPDPVSPRHRHRVRARAWALQVHYRWEAEDRGRTLGEVLDDTLRMRYVAEPRRPHLRRVVEAMDDHLASIDRTLGEAVENWTLDRLAGIDRGVLRIGAAEMLYLDDVPPKVALKEALRLAERYGGDDSARFVNGVLDALLEHAPSGG